MKNDWLDYAQWLTSTVAVNASKVYAVEFGVKIHAVRKMGKSARGTRVYRNVSSQGGVIVTACIRRCAEWKYSTVIKKTSPYDVLNQSKSFIWSHFRF